MISHVKSRTLVAALVILPVMAACSKAGQNSKVKSEAGALTIAAALPKSTGFAFGLSITKLRGTKLFAQLVAQLREKSADNLAELKQMCGIDPFSDLDSFVLVGDESLDSKKMIVFVTGKWDEEKVGKCIAAKLEKDAKEANASDKISVKKEGKLTEYTDKDGDKFYSAWLSPQLAVFAPGDEGKGRLADLVGTPGGIKDNPTTGPLLDKVDTAATAWGILAIPAEGPASQAFAVMGGEKPAGGYLTLNYTKDLDANVGIRFSTGEGAKGMSDKVTKELEAVKSQPLFGDFVKGVGIAATDKDAVMKIRLTEQQLDTLVGMLGSQLGAMLPMMLGGH